MSEVLFFIGLLIASFKVISQVNERLDEGRFELFGNEYTRIEDTGFFWGYTALQLGALLLGLGFIIVMAVA